MSTTGYYVDTNGSRCFACGVTTPYGQTHSCAVSVNPRTLEERQTIALERIAAALEALAARGS